MAQHQYFVYDGVEVIKTGRIASRNHEIRGYNGTKEVTENVVEIAPIARTGESTWKKWVREDELFIINDVGAVNSIPVDDAEVPIDSVRSIDPLDQLLNSLRDRKTDGPT